MTDEPGLYDHYRPTAEASHDEGVYRTVGRSEETVTLLRVADSTGSRRHTGSVVSVTREQLQQSFESAENPDAGVTLGGLLSPLTTFPKALVYWLRQLVP